MNLNLINSFFVDEKKCEFVHNFINEIEKYLENGRKNIKQMEFEMITKFRDQFYIERNQILNNYAKDTYNKGQMYYIYSENSRIGNRYNICICKEGQSNIIIEKDKEELPSGAKVGSVLRENEYGFYVDEDETHEIEEKIKILQERLLEEQKEYLKTKRVEGHIYELFEKNVDRAWLFDITENDNEAIEEIEFPIELLNESNEGDQFIYQNGEYSKK